MLTCSPMLFFRGRNFLEFFVFFYINCNASVLALFCFFHFFLQEKTYKHLRKHILTINKVCLFMSYDTMDYTCCCNMVLGG